MGRIVRALEDSANNTPGQIAVTGSQSSLTWRELYDEVMSVSAVLRNIGTLGLLMENSPAWIVADLSAVHARIVNIPLPGFFSDGQLRHAIEDGQVATVITDNPERIHSILQVEREIRLVIAGKQCTQLFLSPGDADSKHESVAKVTYTSGTTGAPRGVQLSQNAIETVAESLVESAGARRDDRALVLLPLSILLENIGSVYAPVIAGAEIIVPDPADLGQGGSSRMDAERFATALQRIRPTTMILPPQLLKLVVGLAKQQLLPDSFRYIAVGGAPTSIDLLDQAKAMYLPVYQGYGLSEACSVVAVNTPENNRLGSVGRVLPNNKVRISESGEIIIKGVTHLGYLNQPQRNPDAELATGDLGYLDDNGYLYVEGRCRDRIITGYGRNVSPEWVESELQSHPLIAQAAVFGNDIPGLLAVLVPAQIDIAAGGQSGLDQAIREVNERLPDYARVADYVSTEVPFCAETGELTSSGSLCREVIEQRYSEHFRNYQEGGNEQFL